MGIAFTLPLAAWAARRARFETLLAGLSKLFRDARGGRLPVLHRALQAGRRLRRLVMTAFLLKSMAYSSAEVGVVNKVIGLWLTIGGALVGGALMLKLGLWRSLVIFGVLQLAVEPRLLVAGRGRQGQPRRRFAAAFDWGFVKLATATPVDGALLMVVAFENISGGMGTAAFVAFLMSLCNQRFTATQYALLSAFASVGRVWVGPLAGVLAESIGWPDFFLFSVAMAAPGLLAVWWMRAVIGRLSAGPG
jgi:PAT family beta-lactamase induction signal transducer AmpG